MKEGMVTVDLWLNLHCSHGVCYNRRHDKNEMVISFWLLSMSGMTSVLCDKSHPRERVL